MTDSKRRLGRSPARRSEVMDLDLAERTYVLHHGALGHSPHTITHYQKTFRSFRRFLSEMGYGATTAELTTARMNEFALWLRTTPTRGFRGETQRQEAGIHGTMTDLRAFTRSLHEDGVIETLPKVPVNKLPQVFFPILTDEELERVFATKQLDGRTEIGTRNRSLIAFMLDTGVRLSEVAHLQLQDLQLKTGAAKAAGNGSKERLVYFSDGVATAIRRWLDIRGLDDGPLFWLEPTGIRGLFARIQAETGISRLHPHVLRHTFASFKAQSGVSPFQLKEWLGHARLDTTSIYVHLARQNAKKVMEATSL